ncbi:MazG-like family protein [Streptomyces cyaneogriseus]|uniref:MazG-like family protein n=1 Tax=Streptomyces cyaneogriseus TaxID=68192 RepID=UPI0007C665E8|nr:MazG-like family protein [Streptomyces cyaneogriseus]
MSTQTPQRDPWAPIVRLVGWLDRRNGRDQQEISMRLLKLVEEAGEVAQAYIGTVGQNPRKGVTHTREDVADELCDVIITAMVALVSIAEGNPDDILAAKLAKVEKRAARTEEPFPPRGGHDATCAYVSGMTSRCTCSDGGAR